MNLISWVAIVIAGCTLAGCTPEAAPAEGEQTAMITSGSYPASASQASVAAGRSAPPVREASGLCVEQKVARSQSVKGMAKMATAESYELFATGGDLVCSEPGANGVGECELAADKNALVISSEGQRQVQAVGGSARVFYGPMGVSCTQGRVLRGADVPTVLARPRRHVVAGTPG